VIKTGTGGVAQVVDCFANDPSPTKKKRKSQRNKPCSLSGTGHTPGRKPCPLTQTHQLRVFVHKQKTL
jgi:hypothetical protein